MTVSQDLKVSFICCFAVLVEEKRQLSMQAHTCESSAGGWREEEQEQILMLGRKPFSN